MIEQFIKEKPELAAALRQIPEVLESVLGRRLEQLFEAVPDVLERIGASAVEPSQLVKAIACSDFIANGLARDPGLLPALLDSEALTKAFSATYYREQVQQCVARSVDQNDLMRQLRLLRRREMIRIAWREINQTATMEQTLRDLSALADACVFFTLRRIEEEYRERYGQPVCRDGKPQSLVVIAMGKLGGRELNFSSDIDLIFAYRELGELPLAKPMSYAEYFRRMAQQLVQVLSATTPEGIVFRVDLRLRPYGDSGPVVMSFDAMEEYYQTQGRNWERYAMIKARVIAGDLEAGLEWIDMVRPFVYRRYLDYDALEALREMKEMINREVRIKGLQDNIKIGAGGIREIEFIAQSFQLIRAGRVLSLQTNSLLDVMPKLSGEHYLDKTVVDELLQAYAFLRRSENLIQAMDDKQLHAVPADDVGRMRLVHALNYDDWDSYSQDLKRYREKVHNQFLAVFSMDDNEATEEPVATEDHWRSLWQHADDEQLDQSAWEGGGFADVGALIHLLAVMRRSRNYHVIPDRSRNRLDQLMPVLLQEVTQYDNPDETAKRVITFIEAIMGRSAYLALLSENPQVLGLLVRFCSISPWIASVITRFPILVDELIAIQSLYVPLQKEALQDDLVHRLSGVDSDDLERQMEELRHFKQTHFLRVAASDIVEITPLMRVSDYLSYIAEVVLETVVNIAWYQMTARYGRPDLGRDPGNGVSGFAVVAYGKLGGLELGYGSDLDLVFLHSCPSLAKPTSGSKPVETGVFFARLAQRIIHILNTPTALGRLFEVDLRLRPDGASGLMVSGIDAFSDYQQNSAWTWEHQALVRARVVTGDKQLVKQFNKVREQVLTRQRDAQALRQEVTSMREKMRQHLARKHAGEFGLKQDPGGIADIEFIVQYAVLRFAHEYPDLIEFTDNIRQIEALQRNSIISQEQAEVLINAYRSYRARLHRLTLQDKPARVDASEYSVFRQKVRDLWASWMERGELG